MGRALHVILEFLTLPTASSALPRLSLQVDHMHHMPFAQVDVTSKEKAVVPGTVPPLAPGYAAQAASVRSAAVVQMGAGWGGGQDPWAFVEAGIVKKKPHKLNVRLVADAVS